MARDTETDRSSLQEVGDCSGGLRGVAGDAGDGQNEVTQREIGAPTGRFEWFVHDCNGLNSVCRSRGGSDSIPFVMNGMSFPHAGKHEFPAA